MKKYRPLIVDYDSTLVNSQKAVCEIYNKVFCDNVGFKPADWTKVNKWNFTDQCPLLHSKFNAMDIFDSGAFFAMVEFYENAKEAMMEISKFTDIYICSSGTAKNISKKVLWIDEHIPFASIVPVILHGGDGYGKEIIDMRDSVFIDDHAQNLIHSNADIRICYGEEKEWNKDFDGLWIKNWNEDTVNSIIDLLEI